MLNPKRIFHSSCCILRFLEPVNQFKFFFLQPLDCHVIGKCHVLHLIVLALQFLKCLLVLPYHVVLNKELLLERVSISLNDSKLVMVILFEQVNVLLEVYILPDHPFLLKLVGQIDLR